MKNPMSPAFDKNQIISIPMSEVTFGTADVAGPDYKWVTYHTARLRNSQIEGQGHTQADALRSLALGLEADYGCRIQYESNR